MENKTLLLEDEMFAESSSFDNVDPKEGKRLSSLVHQLNQVTKEIKQAEDFLKTLKAQKQNISFEQIPEVMDEMGIDRLDVDGATVSLKSFVSASIPMDKKDEAYAWLRENGYDDIIKNDITLSFGRGEDNVAKDLMVDLDQKGFHPESKTHIHSMTLKAFVRDMVEKGVPIDLDLFGAFVARTAVVKRK
tara:strand:+ start:715 stop:1284 length:570 start_codon:yes stop_codon:yes gene_type:complete